MTYSLCRVISQQTTRLRQLLANYATLKYVPGQRDNGNKLIEVKGNSIGDKLIKVVIWLSIINVLNG